MASRSSLLVLVAGALGVSGPSACGALDVYDSWEAAPPIRVNAIIDIATDNPTDPQVLDFGEVDASETRERELTIWNVGTDMLAIEDVVLPGSGAFSISNPGEYAMMLAPDESTVIRIRYGPTRDEHVQAVLVVASNDRDNPYVAVRVLAEGLAPELRLQPPEHDFGDLEIGCELQVDVEVVNVGRRRLDVYELSYAELPGTGELALAGSAIQGDGDAATVDFALDPTESRTVTVVYSPIDANPDAGVLRVATNTPGEPQGGTVAVQTGVAHAGSSRIDQFVQDGNDVTDVLFVVDNSPSMAEEQTSLSLALPSFPGVLAALGIDYHLSVTTTDAATAGAFTGPVPIVTPATVDPGSAFAAAVSVGHDGSGLEMGYHAAYLALRNAADGIGNNAGFLRDGAALRIVFVSDEQDQSEPTMGWSWSDYVEYYRSIKPNPEHVVTSDITGGMAGCSDGGGSASSGSDYVLGTQATGGISGSICDPGLMATLSALGWLSRSLADTFELSLAPVPSTIDVRVNSVPLFLGWVFDPGLGAIVFDADHVPDNGDVVEIEYAVMSDCGG